MGWILFRKHCLFIFREEGLWASHPHVLGISDMAEIYLHKVPLGVPKVLTLKLGINERNPGLVYYFTSMLTNSPSLNCYFAG